MMNYRIEKKGSFSVLGIKKQFIYMIADPYNPLCTLPKEERLKLATISALTWAIFPAKGPVPRALQSVHDQIFQNWLPINSKYKLGAKCGVELYYDPHKYPKGGRDENYYTEIWVPVALKQRKAN